MAMAALAPLSGFNTRLKIVRLLATVVLVPCPLPSPLKSVWQEMVNSTIINTCGVVKNESMKKLLF